MTSTAWLNKNYLCWLRSKQCLSLWRVTVELLAFRWIQWDYLHWENFCSYSVPREQYPNEYFVVAQYTGCSQKIQPNFGVRFLWNSVNIRIQKNGPRIKTTLMGGNQNYSVSLPNILQNCSSIFCKVVFKITTVSKCRYILTNVVHHCAAKRKWNVSLKIKLNVPSFWLEFIARLRFFRRNLKISPYSSFVLWNLGGKISAKEEKEKSGSRKPICQIFNEVVNGAGFVDRKR